MHLQAAERIKCPKDGGKLQTVRLTSLNGAWVIRGIALPFKLPRQKHFWGKNISDSAALCDNSFVTVSTIFSVAVTILLHAYWRMLSEHIR